MKWINGIGVVLGIWLVYCLVTTAISENEVYLSNKHDAFSTFKGKCVADSGKVRHEAAFLNVNIYCLLPDGDERVFIHNYKNVFAFSVMDKATFEIFELGQLIKTIKVN